MLDDKEYKLKHLLLLLDLLTAVFIYLVSFHLQGVIFPENPIVYDTHVALLPIVIAVQGFSLSLFGVYSRFRYGSLPGFSWNAFRASIATLIAIVLILFLLREHTISRAVLLLFVFLDLLAVVGMRWFLVWWYFKRSKEARDNYRKILIIGTGERAKHITRLLKENAEWGLDIVGYLDLDVNLVGTEVSGKPVLGTVDQISNIVQVHVVDEVIVAVPRSMISNVGNIVSVCQEEGVKLRMMADMLDFQVARMRLDVLGEIPLLCLEPVAQSETLLILKRLLDIFVTLLAMPVILPLMALVALVIKLDSSGPVIFVQQRVGYKRRLFPMYKFRTMVQGSEAMLKDIEHLNEAQGPIFKIANDPRITRVGKILRKTSLDELPQLFNVLLGHMSLVGPRPMSQRDVGLFDQGIQRKRFSVKPGLTCLWQVSGRSNLPFDKWLELDLAYIDNWSLRLDIKILLKTIPVVLRGSGAV